MGSRLEELLAKLPDDKSKFPPSGRRLILQNYNNGQVVTRVYDRANAPEIVLEILRVSQCAIGSSPLEIAPQSQIDAAGSGNGGLFGLLPGGREILFRGDHGSMQLWEPATHEFLGDLSIPDGNSLAFSRNGSLIAIGGGNSVCVDRKTWKVIANLRQEDATNNPAFPQFTPDGRYLLFQTTEPSLDIFDTQTWERAKRPPEIPDDAVQYSPASEGDRAVVRLKSGALALWDTAGRRQVARLDGNVLFSHVCFSPDESMVAVATAEKRQYLTFGGTPRIRVWRSDTGTFIHELRPEEQLDLEQVEGLCWSPKGKYVLAATHVRGLFTSRNISAFEITTGRHRANFTGCMNKVTGMALLTDGSQLIAGCEDGKIRFWDFSGAVKSITPLEKAL
jgi:WD40 repeat protein